MSDQKSKWLEWKVIVNGTNCTTIYASTLEEALEKVEEQLNRPDNWSRYFYYLRWMAQGQVLQVQAGEAKHV